MKYNYILRKSQLAFTAQKNSNQKTKESEQETPSEDNHKDSFKNSMGDVFDCLDVLKIPNLTPTATTLESPPAMAFVTGSTGLIGSLLVRTLLIHRKKLNIPGGVVLLCRPKRNRSGKERIQYQFQNDPMFSFLLEEDFEKLVHIIEGEVTSPNLGMSDDSLQYLSSLNVTHAFHVAASVSFVQPLDNAAESIITSSLQMQTLAKTGFLHPAKYIHFSTAFVHGECTADIVTEEVFDIERSGKYNAQAIYESMMGTQSLAWDAMRNFKFPNTYTFAKSICEHLLLQNEGLNKDTIIIRPSIVGPSISYPYEGWCGNKPSTLVAAACLYLKFQWSLWCFGKINVSVVPVDVVVNFTIRKAFEEMVERELGNDVSTRSDSSDEETLVIHSNDSTIMNGHMNGNQNESSELHSKQIYNVTWDYHSLQSHTFQWCDFASVLTHTGRLGGYLGSFTAYVTLFVAQNLKLSKENHTYFHKLLVIWPYKCVLWLVQSLGFKGISKSLEQMGPFLDLPLLFYHFCNHNFRFESELVAPNEYSGERYMVNCVLAAEDFMSKYNQRQNQRKNLPTADNNLASSKALIAGKRHQPFTSDVWWAMTQPDGNTFIRMAGWILIKILRYTATEVTVDMESFSSYLESHNHPPSIVLAPTHRSLFDFLVISFVCFSLPEIGLAIPHIAAADDFERIPLLGWFARGAQAFFIRRGKGKEDPRLKEEILELKRLRTCQNRKMVLEVFLEGKRSRDRRFVTPKTGLLRYVRVTLMMMMIIMLCNDNYF